VTHMPPSASTALDWTASAVFRFLLAASILFLILPVVVSVVLSFDDRQFLGPFPPKQFSLRWYRSFVDNPAYLDGLIVSLKLAVLSTVISTLAGACAAYDVAVEINSRPERLDPPKRLLLLAAEAGCVFSIDSDAHAPGQLDFKALGCERAERLGIPAERIVTTWPVERVLEWASARS